MFTVGEIDKNCHSLKKECVRALISKWQVRQNVILLMILLHFMWSWSPKGYKFSSPFKPSFPRKQLIRLQFYFHTAYQKSILESSPVYVCSIYVNKEIEESPSSQVTYRWSHDCKCIENTCNKTGKSRKHFLLIICISNYFSVFKAPVLYKFNASDLMKDMKGVHGGQHCTSV